LLRDQPSVESPLGCQVLRGQFCIAPFYTLTKQGDEHRHFMTLSFIWLLICIVHGIFCLSIFLFYIYKSECVCVCVCMFKINSLTPLPIPTKFGVATIQNPATNIGYIRIHISLKNILNIIYCISLQTLLIPKWQPL
jgi:hypothetical protein